MRSVRAYSSMATFSNQICAIVHWRYKYCHVSQPTRRQPQVQDLTPARAAVLRQLQLSPGVVQRCQRGGRGQPRRRLLGAERSQVGVGQQQLRWPPPLQVTGLQLLLRQTVPRHVRHHLPQRRRPSPHSEITAHSCSGAVLHSGVSIACRTYILNKQINPINHYPYTFPSDKYYE